MIPFLGIKETCLYVQDLNKTEAFYKDKLGLEVISKVEHRHVFFRAGTSVLLCFLSEATLNDPKLPVHGGFGIIHFALEVEPEDYENAKVIIEQHNIPIEHEQSWSHGLKSFYFRDPDQHLVEIIQKGIWEK